MYLIRTPKLLHKLFPRRLWELNVANKDLFLTFDDGPHPDHTAFVLDQLKKYGAAATFFCIGKNVQQYPDMYRRIIAEGHETGNHTQHHLKAKVSDRAYVEDVLAASRHIDSNLFRPPYGRLGSFCEKLLREKTPPFQIIMWTVLSGDFDAAISKESCLNNVLLKSGSGSIIVFHDSEKASVNMRYVLPAVLEFFSKRGFHFKKISEGIALK